MIQVRWFDGAIAAYNNFEEAFEAFYLQPDMWKLSFTTLSGKRVILTKTMNLISFNSHSHLKAIFEIQENEKEV
jgi:hypothetical protein